MCQVPDFALRCPEDFATGGLSKYAEIMPKKRDIMRQGFCPKRGHFLRRDELKNQNFDLDPGGQKLNHCVYMTNEQRF